jgi:hypothetical protein
VTAAKRNGLVPVSFLVVNSVLSFITLVAGVVAGMALAGKGLDLGIAAVALIGIITMHATFFAVAAGKRVRYALDDRDDATETGDAEVALDLRWRAVAYDELGREVVYKDFADGLNEPGVNSIDIEAPDLIIIARGGALPIPDDVDPSGRFRPEYPAVEDEFEQYEVGEKNVSDILRIWNRAEDTARELNYGTYTGSPMKFGWTG